MVEDDLLQHRETKRACWTNEGVLSFQYGAIHKMFPCARFYYTKLISFPGINTDKFLKQLTQTKMASLIMKNFGRGTKCEVWDQETTKVSHLCLTRKSSCVNARGIPTAAYQILHLLSYPGVGVPHPWTGVPHLWIGGTLHPDLAGVPPWKGPVTSH